MALVTWELGAGGARRETGNQGSFLALGWGEDGSGESRTRRIETETSASREGEWRIVFLWRAFQRVSSQHDTSGRRACPSPRPPVRPPVAPACRCATLLATAYGHRRVEEAPGSGARCHCPRRGKADASGDLPVIGGFLPKPPGGPRDRPSRGGRRERGLMGGGPGDEGSWPWSDSSQRWPRLHHPQPPSRVTDDRPERARGPSTRLPPDLLLPPPALSRAGRFCRTEPAGWREQSPTPGMTDSGGHEHPAPDGGSRGPRGCSPDNSMAVGSRLWNREGTDARGRPAL